MTKPLAALEVKELLAKAGTDGLTSNEVAQLKAYVVANFIEPMSLARDFLKLVEEVSLPGGMEVFVIRRK